MTEPRKPNLAQNPSEVFNQVIDQRRTAAPPQSQLPGAGAPAEDPQAATKPHPVALALARLRSHGYHEEAKEMERFTREQHDAIYEHHRKGPPPVLDLNALSEEERHNLREQLADNRTVAPTPSQQPLINALVDRIASFYATRVTAYEGTPASVTPANLLEHVSALCDGLTYAEATVDRLQGDLKTSRERVEEAQKKRREKPSIVEENSALRKTLLNIAGMVDAPERLDELSDAEVIGKAVQTTIFAHNDSIRYASQLEEQVKNLKDTKRSDYDEIRQHISRAGGGLVDNVWPALEEVITNLLANQKPEGFENHMKVITDTLATYEAAFAIIENATGLAKSAKAR